jgi:hypothetical protein
MNWIACKSSNIEAVAYDPEKCVLSIRFIKSGDYHYSNVLRYIFDEMMASESVGRYFSENIKSNPNFPFEKAKKNCPECDFGMLMILWQTLLGSSSWFWHCRQCGHRELVE